MQTHRAEFDKKTREAAWDRCGGKCEICTFPFAGRRPEYHHRIPAGLGGDNSLGNCRVICSVCHREITSMEDLPRITKAKRLMEAAANTRQPMKRKIPSRPFDVYKVIHRARGKARMKKAKVTIVVSLSQLGDVLAFLQSEKIAPPTMAFFTESLPGKPGKSNGAEEEKLSHADLLVRLMESHTSGLTKKQIEPYWHKAGYAKASLHAAVYNSARRGLIARREDKVYPI